MLSSSWWARCVQHKPCLSKAACLEQKCRIIIIIVIVIIIMIMILIIMIIIIIIKSFSSSWRARYEEEVQDLSSKQAKRTLAPKLCLSNAHKYSRYKMNSLFGIHKRCLLTETPASQLKSCLSNARELELDVFVLYKYFSSVKPSHGFCIVRIV